MLIKFFQSFINTLIDKTTPKIEITHFNSAKRFFKEKKYASALFNIVEAMRKKSLKPSYFYYKAECLFAQKNYEIACECFENAIKLNKYNNNNEFTNDKAYYNLGQCFNFLNEFAKATECYYQAIAINPLVSEYYHDYAILILSLGKEEEALQCLNKAIEIDALNYKSLNCKANLLYELGRVGECLICFNKSLEINPDNFDALYGKGDLLRKIKRYEEALSYLDKAEKIAPYLQENN